MEELKIQVDPVGQLRLFRANTFTDPYAFLAEAMQNSQRAKATQVWMDFERDQICIRDDGEGLADPNSLFTIAKTGWDKKTQEDEEPFGIGFFSCLALADTVKVTSGKWHFSFSFPKLEAGELAVQVDELEEPEVGFTVVLEDLNAEYDKWSAKSKAREIASTIPGIKTFVNGAEVPVVDFTSPPDCPFVEVKVPHKVRGWIALADYSWTNDIKIYHKGRFVKKLDLNGLRGALEVELKAVNLRAPDRREFIRDSLYEEFISTLREKFIKPFLIQMAGSQMGSCQMDIISHYLEPSDYASQLRYLQLNDPTALDKASKMSDGDLTRMSLEEINDLFSKSLEEPESVRFNEVDSESAKSLQFEPESEKVSSGGYYPSSRGTPIEKQDVDASKLTEPEVVLGLDYSSVAKKKQVYYAEPIDLKRQSTLLAELVKSGQMILVARTSLELKVLKEALSAVYIGTAEIKEEHKASVSNREATAKYLRVQALLKVLLVSTHELAKLDLKLAPGSISVVTSRVIGDQVLSKRQSYPPFYVTDGVLVVDTTKLKHSRVLGIKDSRADLGELMYLMENIEELADCLHVSTGTICRALAGLKISWIITQIKEEEVESN